MSIAKQSFSFAAALAFAFGSALAQTSDKPASDMQGMNHKPMAHDMMANMPSMHMMPATVTAVDAKTGIVEVKSEGMTLKVHFPANTVADLKAGDKITLHLGFSKE